MTTRRRRSQRRIGASAALAGLALLGVALASIHSPDVLAVLAGTAAVALVAAHRSLRLAFRESRTALLLVGLAALFEAATGDAANGLVLWLRFSTLVMAAQTVTRLLSWSEICDAMVTLLRPLDRLGLVDAERCAFTLMLAIRFVPVMFEEVAEIREAQALRGRDRSVFALAVPLGVRVLLRAEEIAEAADLRGRPSSRSVRGGGAAPFVGNTKASRTIS